MKKKHAEEHENLERWLVSYADFITLLFAFFTVMYALSNSDKAKYQKAAEGIKRAFLTGGGLFPMAVSSPPQFSPSTSKKSSGEGEAIPLDSTGKTQSRLEGLFEESTGLDLKGGNEISVIKTDDGFKIVLSEKLLFASGSDKIKKRALSFLYELGVRLAKMGVQILVEGYTDNVPLKGGETNWQLSLSRAYHVATFLIEGASFPKQKIGIAGFGDARPISSNDTPEGRARNRRVEISVITPDRNILQMW